MTDMDHMVDAYIDNQLDTAGRIRVETHLGTDPVAAARVMADLGVRSALRLALMDQDTAQQPRTRDAARQLETGLGQKKMWTALQRIAAVGILVSLGWLASASVGPFSATSVIASVHPPAYVEEAIKAHRTTLVRELMPSQPETTDYDPEDIRAATAIVMPTLPKDWQVIDVQVFPSDFGPSVEMSIKTGDGDRISLFAVRPGFFAVEKVMDIDLADADAAYWQIGEVAYAVIASKPNSGLAEEARLLTSSIF